MNRPLNLKLSPLQKLTRLKELQSRIDAHPTIPGLSHCDPDLDELRTQRDQLFATIGTPPIDLFGNSDPSLWSAAFHETFPDIDVETAQAWFANLALASYDAGRFVGQGEGRADRRGVTALVDALQVILEGVRRNAIRSQMVTANDKPPRTLERFIVDALAAAGVTE